MDWLILRAVVMVKVEVEVEGRNSRLVIARELTAPYILLSPQLLAIQFI